MYCPHCMQMVSDAKKTDTCPSCGGNLNVQNLEYQLPIGTVLANRYYLGKVIGQGGFGITYVGCDTKLNMKIAVKEYYPQELVNRITKYSHELTVTAGNKRDLYERQKQRFISEAKILAEFADNPNVVRVSDILTSNNTIYIVMEYIDGTTLETYCRENGKLTFNEAVSMLNPIMEALDEIHSKGLIHRDITPTNIMITNRRKVVKLLDFGAAADYGTDLNRSISVILKEGYAPPEQYSSHGNRGPWSDVYALCATIYSLITGVIPENSVERMTKDGLKYPSELGVKITPEQEAVLMCGLAVQLGQRFASMKELQNGFHSAENGGIPECAKSFVRNKKRILSPSYQETEILPKDSGGRLERKESIYSQTGSNEIREDAGGRKQTKSRSIIVRFSIVVTLIAVCAVLLKPYYKQFRIAVEQNYAERQKYFGDLCYEGYKSLSRDYEAAARYYRLAADKGNIEAQNKLGYMYRQGLGVDQNFEEALKYYRLAADQGNAEAQNELGFMYEIGSGVEQDYKKALNYYLLAAEQGYAEAQLNLGNMYRFEHGATQDYKKAVGYYQLAADQGNAEALYNLGNMYYNGYGVDQDYEEAVKYLRLAAEQGYIYAQINLGDLYYYGYGVDQNYEEAVKYYQLVSDRNCADAQQEYNLGYLYENGYGTDKDYKLAVKHYALAANKRFADAQYSLGNMYYYGYGVDKSYKKAVKYYQLASDQGYTDAQYQLGSMYYHGYGVDKDYKKAAEYFRLAADQGHAGAQCSLGVMYYRGYGVDKDYVEAVKYYRLAASQGYADAQCNLGYMYQYGYGVTRDKEEALRYYRLASDQGDITARQRLEWLRE